MGNKTVAQRLQERGYTLIEVMIVVLVVAILMAVGLSLYQNFVVRARVVEGMSMSVPAKLQVLENLASGEADYALGWREPSVTSNVASVSIEAVSGAITVEFTDPAGGGSIIYRPSINGVPLSGVNNEGTVVWDCTGGTLDVLYRPTRCR